MSLPMVIIPTPLLRERSIEVDERLIGDADIQQFIAEMIPHMYAEDGIGLAAPQVGKGIRVCIIGKEAIDSAERPVKTNKKTSAEEKDLVLINPTYQKLSRKTTSDTEGCLSVPGFYGQVKRHRDIQVTAFNEKGERLEFEAHNFFARVIQHEVDHLNGILFIDRATDLYKNNHRRLLDTEVVMQNIKKINERTK